jgi:hypothetical protein
VCTSPGTFTITWTLNDFLGPDYSFAITDATVSGAATGPVTFVPTVLADQGQTATGTTLVSGDTVGDVVLDVTFEVTYVPEGTTLHRRQHCDGHPRRELRGTTVFTDHRTCSDVVAGGCGRPRDATELHGLTASRSIVTTAL